jgi:8-oxo-dGTP diphosphatase
LVVAAALTDSLFLPRHLLAAQRSAPKSLAGKWELPGGKTEPGETAREALRRELREELGVDVEMGDEVAGPDSAGTDVHGVDVGGCWELNPGTADGERLVMRVWWAELADSEVEPQPLLDHSDLRWLGPGKWFDVGWIPADNKIISAIIDDAAARHRRAYC